MKKYFFLLFSLVFLAACNDDDNYSKNDCYFSIGTVENDEDSPNFYIRLDNDVRLWVAVNNFYNYSPNTGQRIAADYTILNKESDGNNYDYDIQLNEAYNLLTKDIFYVTEVTQDSIGNDGIQTEEIWIGSHYVNIRFYYSGYDKTHYINLVKDDSKVYNDNKLHLEFRHNENGDRRNFVYSGIASFDLNSLKNIPPGNEMEIRVHVRNYNNQESYYDLTYKRNEKNSGDRQLNLDTFTNSKDTDIQ